MAHFAQLDENNKVVNVVVIGNPDCIGEQGVECEQTGIVFCKSLFGSDTIWVQTSINNRIRKNYAGIGYLYDQQRDAFIPPQPYPSWVINEDTCQWTAPVPKPEDTDLGVFIWDEETVQWIALLRPEEDNPAVPQ